VSGPGGLSGGLGSSQTLQSHATGSTVAAGSEKGHAALLADRRPAYRSLGLLAAAAGSKILNNAAVLASLMTAIQSGFRVKPFCEEAVECLRMVVSASARKGAAPKQVIGRWLGKLVASLLLIMLLFSFFLLSWYCYGGCAVASFLVHNRRLTPSDPLAL